MAVNTKLIIFPGLIQNKDLQIFNNREPGFILPYSTV